MAKLLDEELHNRQIVGWFQLSPCTDVTLCVYVNESQEWKLFEWSVN